MWVACILLLASCNKAGTGGNRKPQTLQKDTIVYLSSDRTGPSCEIHITYTYLESESETDSVTPVINRTILAAGYGGKYGSCTPDEFVSRFSEGLIKDYREDVEDLYKAEAKRGTVDFPSWYSYKFDFQTSMSMGADGVWNYVISSYLYTGGAHDNTLYTCLNVDSATGRLITVWDVFRKECESDICALILEELIEEANVSIEGASVSSLKDLQEYGILLNTDLYVPSNFILERDEVTFVYNQYDIAPYAAGAFELSIPVRELADYMQ